MWASGRGVQALLAILVSCIRWLDLCSPFAAFWKVSADVTASPIRTRTECLHLGSEPAHGKHVSGFLCLSNKFLKKKKKEKEKEEIT